MNRRTIVLLAASMVMLGVISSVATNSKEANSDEVPGEVTVGARDTVKFTHYNIRVVLDVTNRIKGDAVPVLHDTIVCQKIIEWSRRLALDGPRKFSVHDELRFELINDVKGRSAYWPRISLRDKNQEIRAGGYDAQLKNLNEDIASFYRETGGKAYEHASGDLIGHLSQVLNSDWVKEGDVRELNRGLTLAQDVYRSIVIVITDGYLDLGHVQSPSANRLREFGEQALDKIRRCVKSDNSTVSECIDQLGMNLQSLSDAEGHEVYFIQLMDRSLKPTGSATVIPTDYRILSEVWSKWGESCGFSRFEVKPNFRNEDELMTFLNKIAPDAR